MISGRLIADFEEVPTDVPVHDRGRVCVMGIEFHDKPWSAGIDGFAGTLQNFIFVSFDVYFNAADLCLEPDTVQSGNINVHSLLKLLLGVQGANLMNRFVYMHGRFAIAIG